MNLTDLSPRWIVESGRRIGVSFDAPDVARKTDLLEYRVHVLFDTATDGGPGNAKGHHRDGENFDDLTLTPSILTTQDAGEFSWSWHGFLTNGEVTSC